MTNKTMDDIDPKQEVYLDSKRLYGGVLEDYEIEQAEREIAEMYPIANTDFDVSFPWLGCFCKGFSRLLGGVKDCVQKRRREAERKRVEAEDMKASTSQALARALLVPQAEGDGGAKEVHF